MKQETCIELCGEIALNETFDQIDKKKSEKSLAESRSEECHKRANDLIIDFGTAKLDSGYGLCTLGETVIQVQSKRRNVSIDTNLIPYKSKTRDGSIYLHKLSKDESKNNKGVIMSILFRNSNSSEYADPELLFSFTEHNGIYSAAEGELKTPEQFSKVLNILSLMRSKLKTRTSARIATFPGQ
jgi:hypothetical protein